MIVILTGPVHSGKTTLLWKAAETLAEKGPALGGYLTPSKRDPEGRVLAYELLSLSDGTIRPFLERKRRPAGRTIGPYRFCADGLRLARELIRTTPPSVPLVVDEIGPCELAGRGVRKAVDEALAIRRRAMLLVIRETLLQEALDVLDIGGARILDVRAPNAGETLVRWIGGTFDGSELC